MPLRVISLCRYFANRGMPWRPEDYDAYKWIQALKGKSLSGYGYVPVGTVRRRLSNQNLTSAVRWFAELAVPQLRTRGMAGPFIVIPVPNSACTIASSVPPRTRRLARALTQELGDGSTVVDCLRWKRNLGSASKEAGPRDPGTLYNNIAVLKDFLRDVDKNTPVLLVDDITTSGGHLRASAAKLREAGLNVTGALCGGRTLYDQEQRAFSIVEEMLDDFVP